MQQEIHTPDKVTEAIKHFKHNYLVSFGKRGESDGGSDIETYVIPKRDFKHSFKNVLKALPKVWDDTAEDMVHLFSRFSIRIPTNSPYDCTGRLIGYGRRVKILADDYEWVIITFTDYSYDL